MKAINLTFYFAASRVVLFACFITFVLTHHPLTAESVFVTMALFNGLQFTMTYLFPFAIGNVAEANVTCTRVLNFLTLEEKPQVVNVNNNISSKNLPKKVNDSPQNRVQPSLLEVNHLTAKWEADSEPVLRNISFSLKPGQLLAVIGPVGCGKSTLLMAMMSELPHMEPERVKINGSLAYASQEPWSFNASVRDNILFGQPYDEAKYKNVIRVAALERDLSIFPHSDHTLVGERGVSLSGGQKARVSLARYDSILLLPSVVLISPFVFRTLYKEADIYFLDDPLSAVDAGVANHLFDE